MKKESSVILILLFIFLVVFAVQTRNPSSSSGTSTPNTNFPAPSQTWNQSPTNTNSTNSTTSSAIVLDVGISSCVRSSMKAGDEPTISGIANRNNLSFIRYSLGEPTWNGYVFDSSIVSYFLANTQSVVIVDVNHLYPRGSASDSQAVQNWGTVTSNLLSVCQSFPNNSRVWIELINEYDAGDFYSRMEGLITTIRSAGYTNTLVVDKTDNIPWKTLYDPLANTYQGEHYYFDGDTVSFALSDMRSAINLGITKLLNTEVGANGNGASTFNTTTVQDVSSFLSSCETLHVFNCVWLDVDAGDWTTYVTLGLTLPNRGTIQ